MPSISIWRLTMGLSRKLRPCDHAGQTQAADGGGIQSGFWSAKQMRARAVRAHQLEALGTWQPKVPATWWFLPWMSLAMAPPSVTYFVPGETGRKKPRGTAKSRICASVMPASAVRTPVAASKRAAVHARGLDERAILEQADVAVAAAHPTGSAPECTPSITRG